MRWSRLAGVAVTLTLTSVLTACTTNGAGSSEILPGTVPGSSEPSPGSGGAGTAVCAGPALKAAISGGGSALGYVAVIIRFTNAGATCRLGGWPQVAAFSARSRASVTGRLLAGPALARGAVSGPRTFDLKTGDGAYLIVSGSAEPDDNACSSPYRRFAVRLPAVPVVFRLPARVPNYANYFPSCVPLLRSPLVAASDIISKFR
jgi:hypothetical protein